MKSSSYYLLFFNIIDKYHLSNDVNTLAVNPYDKNSLENLLFEKCWIDTVQWHLEDMIRSPKIKPENGMKLKNRIDSSNQNRTDIVEKIDDYFYTLFNKSNNPNAKLNTESPGWVVDRMSILCLKIFHMKEQVDREDVEEKHINNCKQKLHILKLQQEDLGNAFDELLNDYKNGSKKMQVYRQMKMYNDKNLNPELYNDKEQK